MSRSLLRRGRCHVYGDRVPLDEGVMPFEYAIKRVTDPALLVPHLFEGYDDGFAARVAPGDFILAGREFGCGKPHVQGLLALASLGMGILCESMPYKAHRRAVSEGLPVLSGCEDLSGFAATGDEIEVDFESGAARNLTRGSAAQFPAMPAILRELVERGGMQGALRAWLALHPAQAGAAPPLPGAAGVRVDFVAKAPA